MQELITKNYGGFVVEFELVRGRVMANATSMCAIFEKRPAKWLELDSTKRYIAALAKSENRTCDNQLVITKQHFNAGTWIDERLILRLAQWLDVEFEVQCDQWLAELLRTGRVEIAPMLSPEELLVRQAQALLDQSHRLKAVEVEQINLQQQVDEVVAKQTTIEANYYTVAGWASKQKLRKSPQEINYYGRRAAAMSRDQGYTIGQVYDAKYASVGTYHIDILSQVFSQQLPLPQRGQSRPAARS